MPLLAAGDKLGPYEIQEQLGAGGMGEVWKALDTRLNRFVAIKKSQAKFSERFSREAQAIAALNHPHICQLYDVGPDYLVMEYVEGKPLTGPIPVAQSLEYAAQICDALDTAHRKGITHRDLKPANILVGKAGVKILDFGLAKMETKPQADANATATMALTGEGTIVGTLQYMSPEQIEGQEADARSDIFALGLVLYEMISGARPFTGKSKTSLIASILKEQPKPLRETEPLTPASLERVVQTCLEKDPDKRWQSARELKHALDWIQAGGTSAVPPGPVRPTKSKTSWTWTVVGVLGLVILAAGALALWLRPSAPARATRFQVNLPDGVKFADYVSISPDGHKLVFNATGDQSGLWIHDLDTLEWRKLQGTEEGASPFWSPDSRYLGFRMGQQLKKIEVAGGPAETLCSVTTPLGTGAWSRDGVIVFGSIARGPMYRVSAAGGVPTQLTNVGTGGFILDGLPSFLADGKHFLYLRVGVPDVMGIYVGSIDAKPEEQSRQRILATRVGAYYVDGNFFFLRDGTLMTQPFDTAKLQLRGEPVPIAEHIGIYVLTAPMFSVSTTGVLVYKTDSSSAGGFQTTWLDRDGKAIGAFGQPGADQGLALAPDASRALVRDADRTANGDLWMIEFARGVRTRFTFRQSIGSFGVWSPDGSQVIFAAGNALDTIYEKPASGAGEEKELLKKAGEPKQPTSWSRDGRFLLYFTVGTPKTGNDLWVLPLQDGAGGKPVLLLGTEFNEAEGSFSPDGRWIAYVSNESGRSEVYVRPFVASGPSSPALGEGKWQVSKDGAAGGLLAASAHPRWRADGKEIIFGAPNGSPMAVEVNGSGAAFQAGVPKQLFAAPPNNGWDVTGDGKRFLISVAPAGQNTQTPITVVLNWQADLKK